MNTIARLSWGALVVATACSDARSPDHADTTRSTGVVVPPPAIVDTSMSRSRPADTLARGATTSPAIAHDAPTQAGAKPVARRRHVDVLGVDLTGLGYDRGSANAPVVIVEFSDFACPYCGSFARETYPQIEEEYVKTGKVFFKYIPFVAGPFPHANEATRAAECAADQDRFWPALDQIFALQGEWKPASDPMPALLRALTLAGADTGRAAACIASGRTDARTRRATAAANDFGVRVTPSFLVSERPIQGALPIKDFRRVIEAALIVAGLHK